MKEGLVDRNLIIAIEVLPVAVVHHHILEEPVWLPVDLLRHHPIIVEIGLEFISTRMGKSVRG